MRLVARQVVTESSSSPPPALRPLGLLRQVGNGPGMLMIDGVLSVDVRVGDRTATEIVGDGDVLQPLAARADDLLERTSAWHALVPARLALLDDAFAEQVKPWPQISPRCSPAPAHAPPISTPSARSPRSRAWRCGSRCCSGTWRGAGAGSSPAASASALPLTHRLLGRLVGAERPSVSHALSRLPRAGLVTSRDGALHLHGTADEHLAALSTGRANAARASRRRGRRVSEDRRLHRQRPGRREHDRPRALADQRPQL